MQQVKVEYDPVNWLNDAWFVDINMLKVYNSDNYEENRAHIFSINDK